MIYCENCGAKLPDGKLTCPECGSAVPREIYTERDYSNYAGNNYSGHYAAGYTSREPAYDYSQNEKKPERVLGTGAFFGSVLLMSLPVIGLLFQIIWALGGTGSLNRRNLARTYLIFSVIGIVYAILAVWFITDTVVPLIETVLQSSEPEIYSFLSTIFD